MAMLQTTTKQAGEPKGPPAGKAAPAKGSSKTSPEAIRAGMHLTGNQGAQLDRIVLAGRRVMFDKTSHHLFLDQLDGPGTLAQKLGQGVAGLVSLLWQESKQSLPPQLLIPAGTVLVAVAADFLKQGGMDVSDQDVAGGIEAMVTALFQAAGVDPDKVAAAGEKAGQGKAPTRAPAPAEEAAEGEAA